MCIRLRLIAAACLFAAVAATLASGAARHLLTYPARRTVQLDRPLPVVSTDALERGCAAWGEALAECVGAPDEDPFVRRRPIGF